MLAEATRISRGPDIRWATQLIASYYHDQKKLGPAVAQGKLNELFEEDTYTIIRSSPPRLVYQLYLLAEISGRCLRRLSSSKQYISNVYGYIDLSAFSLICRALSEAGLPLGEEDLEFAIEKAYDEDSHEWLPAMKCLVDHILADYSRAKRKALRQEDSELTAANYFKSTKHIGLLLQKPIPRHVKRMAQIIKRSV